MKAPAPQRAAAAMKDRDGDRMVVSAIEAPLPAWARPGNFAFMAMSGGPLEAEKGLRSGWDGFSRDDPLGNVRSTRDFYRPENIEIPLTAGVNWLYVIWSNGWSKEREARDQWPHAARFMRDCQRRGLHVTAYLSAANMFWEDYLEAHLESRQWIDTQEPSVIRHYGGSLYRVMARLSHPGWRAQIKLAIDAALDAGAEGFWVDNLSAWHGESLVAEFLREMRQHAARRRSELVWHINVNSGIYQWGRAGNVVGTEDGRAPQFDANADPPVKSNLGTLALVSGLHDGWRSTELEHYGNKISAEARQLLIAECWMWQTGAAWLPVDRGLRTALHDREPAAWKVLEAMGLYYKHQLRHAEYFQAGDSLASVAVVAPAALPDGSGTAREYRQSDLTALLELLAIWNVPFEVVFDDRIDGSSFRDTAVVVVPDPHRLPQTAVDRLSRFAVGGGVVLAPSSSQLTATALPAAAFLATGNARLLREAIVRSWRTPAVAAELPVGVVVRAIRQPQRVVVHVLNYRPRPTAPFTLRYRGRVSAVVALAPEWQRPRALNHRLGSEGTLIDVPEFPIHCLAGLQTVS